MTCCRVGTDMGARSALFLLLCALWASCLRAQQSPEWRQFHDFTVRYGKPYRNDSDAFNRRFTVFKESRERQRGLNDYESKHGGSAVYGVNIFSDLSPQEFRDKYLSGLKRSAGKTVGYQHSRTPTQTPPDKFDWRDKDVIGKVRNQGQCGSCWAFATVETIASRYAIQSHPLVELSVQQLISCDVTSELSGCKGGTLLGAFETVNGSMVIVKESVYPFKSGDGDSHSCKTNLPHEGVEVNNFTYRYQVSNESNMVSWLFNFSPLTISVNARAWQDYDGGIMQHHCSGVSVDHAVQVVGYDLTGPVPYWVVRNTWGTDWGEDGYAKLKFGQNTCGMTDEVVFVTDVVGVGI